MEFLDLNEERSVLKVEDILPFFPEFTLIDDFKEQICSSLVKYNEDIDTLRKQMDQSTAAADEIRSDIQKISQVFFFFPSFFCDSSFAPFFFSQKFGFVDGQQVCQVCEQAVLTREFYLFPCQHAFHADCFTNSMLQTYFDDQQVRKRDGPIEIF